MTDETCGTCGRVDHPAYMCWRVGHLPVAATDSTARMESAAVPCEHSPQGKAIREFMLSTSQFIFTGWSHPALKAEESAINGTGLYTSTDIREGEIVVIWGGVLVPYEAYDESKHKARATTAFDETYCLTLPIGALDSVDEFLNHSCDPNTWMEGERHVIARRNIEAGEEITTDFALWWTRDYLYTDQCSCGSPLCRTRVTGMDWKLPELQERYRGHFQPFINRMLGQETIKRRRRIA